MNHYHRIADSLTFVAEHFQSQPTLAELAAQAHMSEYHFQRVFSDWAGVSPKKFLQYITLDYARQCLDDSASILDASHSAGLSGPSRLHDLFVTVDALSPGEYKAGGAGLQIDYGFHTTAFGVVLIAVSARGISWLSFVEDDDHAMALDAMQQKLPNAVYQENQRVTDKLAEQIFSSPTDEQQQRQPVSLLLAGTPFQLQVWQALLSIPEGACTTYGKLAAMIDREKAHRAVGTAVGANPVACLIPCHRVIRQNVMWEAIVGVKDASWHCWVWKG